MRRARLIARLIRSCIVLLARPSSLRNVCDAEVVAELRQTVSVDGINLLKLLHDASVCTLCVNALEAIIFIGEESGMF